MEGYSLLKKMRLEIKNGDCFSLYFWLYLSTSNPSPFTTLIRQICTEAKTTAPFLVLDEKRKMKLLPLIFQHKDGPFPVGPTQWKETCHVSNEIVFPSEKWVHIGCEVGYDFLRLHIDGEIVVEKLLDTSSTINREPVSRKVHLAGFDRDDDKLRGYLYNVEVLNKSISVKDHRAKNTPVQLSVARPSASEIEVDSDGVWNIVGGLARQNFSVDVTLLDVFHQPVTAETEVVASLSYSDNGVPVGKRKDAEAPLLTTNDGMEYYASSDRPNKLINGRTSFKLKISQLSSYCENRLFRVRFEIPKMGGYPFLEAFFGPIRCISQNRNTWNSLSKWKKLSSGVYKLGEAPSNGLDNEACELPFSVVREAKLLSPSSKRVKLGQESSFVACKADISKHRAFEECNSIVSTTEDDTARLHQKTASHGDLDRDEARKSDLNGIANTGAAVTDRALFKYCLGSFSERALMLKEITAVATGSELADFAKQVSLHMGCSHHGNQILLGKRLLEEGTKAWDLISENKPHVMWEDAVPTIKLCFERVSCCITRNLTLQDMDVLRRIAGCQQILTHESFERMWSWLYPVALTLSRVGVKEMWKSGDPKWIEGFVTKEEAEYSVQWPGGVRGIFVLRFPTSRSWPHPDAGNLVVTYIGKDGKIHHRMLSLDSIFSSSEKGTAPKSLHEMLLAESELALLARFRRSPLPTL